MNRLKIKALSVEETKDAINKLNQLDLASVDIDRIKELLTPLFAGYMTTGPETPPGTCFYRGRKISAEVIATAYQDLLHPPTNYICLGRCNRHKDPIFYVSNFRNVAFFELEIKAGDHFLLGKWRSKHELVFNQVGYSSNSFAKLGSVRKAGKWSQPAEKDEAEERNTLVREWLASKFTEIVGPESVHHYKLTAAITEKMLNAPFFSGLMYPTIPMKANGDNFAILPRVLNSSLECLWVKRFLVKEVKEFSFEVEEIDFANGLAPNTPILWKGRKGEWKPKESGGEWEMVVENGEYVCYDKNRNCVEPE